MSTSQMAENTPTSRNEFAQTFTIESDMSVIKIQGQDRATQNDTINEGDSAGVPLSMDARVVSLIFNLENEAKMVFQTPAYEFKLEQGNVYIMYNPTRDLSMHIDVNPKSRLLIMMFSIEKIHGLFMGANSNAELFDAISVDKKYYSSTQITPAMYMVLEQLYFARVPENTRILYLKAKVLEVLSLFFGANDDLDVTGCPFLNDEATVQKVHKAKELVIRDVTNPPTIKELCQHVGLNEYQLKVGFKRLYGSPIHQYANNHRLNHAKSLLMSGKFKVNEVAWEIGYTNTSHFIAAFKRSFGITPKKYLMSLE